MRPPIAVRPCSECHHEGMHATLCSVTVAETVERMRANVLVTMRALLVRGKEQWLTPHEEALALSAYYARIGKDVDAELWKRVGAILADDPIPDIPRTGPSLYGCCLFLKGERHVEFDKFDR